jgi:hypothetical protein
MILPRYFGHMERNLFWDSCDKFQFMVKRRQVAGGAMDAAPVGVHCDAAQSGCFLFCKQFLDFQLGFHVAQQDSITALS